MQYAAALTSGHGVSAAPSGLRLELIHRAEAHAPPRGHETAHRTPRRSHEPRRVDDTRRADEIRVVDAVHVADEVWHGCGDLGLRRGQTGAGERACQSVHEEHIHF